MRRGPRRMMTSGCGPPSTSASSPSPPLVRPRARWNSRGPLPAQSWRAPTSLWALRQTERQRATEPQRDRVTECQSDRRTEWQRDTETQRHRSTPRRRPRRLRAGHIHARQRRRVPRVAGAGRRHHLDRAHRHLGPPGGGTRGGGPRRAAPSLLFCLS